MLPDDLYPERNIYIFAGKQLIAKRERGQWFEAEVLCNRCGECCKNLPDHWRHGVDEKGWCVHLREVQPGDYVCTTDMPFGCANGDFSDEDWCCVKWQQR